MASSFNGGPNDSGDHQQQPPPASAPKNKRICEVCGQADRRPTSSFLQDIVTCEACKKFLERCQKQNKVKLRCKMGGRRGVTCNLATDRPCPRCRLDKAIQLVNRMKASKGQTVFSSGLGAAFSASTSTPSTSQQQQQGDISNIPSTSSRTDSLNVYFQRCTETNTVETVKKLQLRVELLKYLKKSQPDGHQGGGNAPQPQLQPPPPPMPPQQVNLPEPMILDPIPGPPSAFKTHSPLPCPQPVPVVEAFATSYAPAQPQLPTATSTMSSLMYVVEPYTNPHLESPSPTSSSSLPSFHAAMFDQNPQMGWSQPAPQPPPPPQQQTVMLPMSPVVHDNVRNEVVIRQIMRADQELTAKKYRCDASYLMKKGIPDEETEFWKLISWCVQDIAFTNLPFATQLAGSLCRISHIDMCRLVENSYSIMFYCQTSLPNRLDVVTAFGMLFTKMRYAWKEVDVIMDHTREIVTAIREWKPSTTEFAFLLATIFCHAVPKDKILVPETLTQLEHLTEDVKSAAHAHMIQVFGENLGQIRFQQLQCITTSIVKVRDGRRFALRRFYERNPTLAKQTVHPVIELVCRQYRDLWQQDYCAINLPSYPPPMNYECRRGVDEFTEVIMNNI